MVKTFFRNRKEIACDCDVLILPLIEGKGIQPYGDIDKALNGNLSNIVSSKEFRGKLKEVVLLHTLQKIKPKRILLVGLGRDVNRERLREAGGSIARILDNPGIREIVLSTRTIAQLGFLSTDFLEGFLLSDYSFRRYQKERERKRARSITLLTLANLRNQIHWTEVVVSATHFARDLVNTPSNDMTPSALARAARSLKNVSVNVIEKKQAEKLGMGAYLSVSRGSAEPPKFIVLSYKGKNTRPLVLIGKSITFDSGGISLKPSQGMEKMKYDMAGGAAVLGVFKAASEMNLKNHIIGVLPATENLPGGSASRPGDVVSTVEGKTIEIITTDAEGRLAIADAIGYVKKFKPSAVIDIATLTGACPIALGREAIAMMGNDESLMKDMKKASEESGERVWQMPLFEEYRDYIKSDIADLKNSAGRVGSLVTSGFFLKEFAGSTPWVHLDIAGTAWTDKDKSYTPKGATGIGVRLLLHFLLRK
jgi:leucyl aminopeptidase